MSDSNFVAVCDVRLIRWRLGQRYPWLEHAFAAAYAAAFNLSPLDVVPFDLVSDSGGMNACLADKIARTFISSLQRMASPAPDKNWIPLEQGVEEHAAWVTRTLLTDLLPRDALTAKVPELIEQPSSVRARAVLGKSGAFVALVNTENEFVSLIDRSAYIERVAATFRGDAG